MAMSVLRPSPLLLLTFLFLLVLSFSSHASAKKKPYPRPITDNEIREKKNACYADIESGLWGPQCRSSMIEKENCALQCLSPQCFDHIYKGDPLEEGEKDYIRGQEYKFCMHKLSLGESLEGIKGAFDY